MGQWELVWSREKWFLLNSINFLKMFCCYHGDKVPCWCHNHWVTYSPSQTPTNRHLQNQSLHLPHEKVQSLLKVKQGSLNIYEHPRLIPLNLLKDKMTTDLTLGVWIDCFPCWPKVAARIKNDSSHPSPPCGQAAFMASQRKEVIHKRQVRCRDGLSGFHSCLHAGMWFQQLLAYD